MTFLNPAGLLFLAVVPVIVLLHLFRQERRRQEVSSLFLWREISDQHSRRIRPQLLRNINLLLQVLAAILISIAIARPTIDSATGDGSPRMIVLIDTSASMGAREGQVSRLDLAKNRARELVGRARRDTEIMIATAGPLPAITQGFTADRSVVYEKIRLLEVEDGAGELRAAAAMIRSLGDTAATDVVFVTDGAFDAQDSVALPAGFRVEPVGTPQPNIGITAFELRRRFDASVLEAYLEIGNFGISEDSVLLELRADDVAISRREFTLPAGTIEQIPINLPGSGGAVFEAAIVDHEDSLASDDAAFAVAGSTRPLRVQLVTPGNYFLESILSVYPNVRLTVTDRTIQDGQTDVYVIDSVDVPAGLTGSILVVNTGFPGGPFEQSGYEEINRQVTVNPAHPIARNLDLSDVSFTRVIGGDLSSRALPVASVGATPVIYTFAQANIRLAGFLFSLSETDLGLRSSFPILMNNVISWLAPSPRETGISSVAAGTVVPLLVTPGSPFTITSPSGDRSEYLTRENTFAFRDTLQTGIYEISGASFSDVFAVSLTDAGESNLLPRFSGSAEEEVLAVAGVTDSGRPVFHWMLILAVLLLTADWVIWARRS